MTFPGLEKILEFHDFSRFSMTGYTLVHPLTNVPTKCQPSTPNGIKEIT